MATHQNKECFMELKGYSTKWVHSERPALRLKYFFVQKGKHFTGRKNLVNGEIPLTRPVGGAVA